MDDHLKRSRYMTTLLVQRKLIVSLCNISNISPIVNRARSIEVGSRKEGD
jgi:hypothetical protein